MSERMTPIPFEKLMAWLLAEHKATGAAFGVPAPYVKKDTAKVLPLFGEKLETPFGPAAGPNTQLAHPHLGGDVHIVVDDADGALFPAQGHEPLRLRQEVRLAQVLFPQLDDAGPAVDGLRHLAEQALRAAGPGPVRHSIQPQPLGVDLHTSHPSFDAKNHGHTKSGRPRQRAS